MSRVTRVPDFDASVFGSVRFFCDAKRPFGKGIRTAYKEVRSAGGEREFLRFANGVARLLCRGSGGVREVFVVSGVKHGAARINHHALAVGGKSRGNGSVHVSALGADARHQ